MPPKVIISVGGAIGDAPAATRANMPITLLVGRSGDHRLVDLLTFRPAHLPAMTWLSTQLANTGTVRRISTATAPTA